MKHFASADVWSTDHSQELGGNDRNQAKRGLRLILQVPSQIEKLIAEKKYYAAVQLHIQSISMLEREGIQSVRNCYLSVLCLSAMLRTHNLFCSWLWVDA